MLTLIPISLSEANNFVAAWHRHHKPVVGHKFSIGCEAGGRLVGVAIVGRPASRYLDDGKTLEVNRLCTDGTKNACSFLYAAAARAARAMGYQRINLYAGHRRRRKSARCRLALRGTGRRHGMDRCKSAEGRTIPGADEAPL